jgi:hypothetical protein
MIEAISFIGVIAGGLVALGIIWKSGLLPLYHFLRKMDDVHTIILEFPSWKTGVDDKLKQLEPNGGGSMKDIVIKSGEDVRELKASVMDLKQMVERHVNDTDAHSNGQE